MARQAGPALNSDEPQPGPRRGTAFVRSRALALIGFASVVWLLSAVGAGYVWFLELPIHFQPQYACLLLLCALALAGSMWRLGQRRRIDYLAVIGAIVIAVAAAAQVFRLTPAQRQLLPPSIETASAGARLRILSCNVQSENRRHDAVLDLVAAESPDIVLITELNHRWQEALAPLAAQFPHHLEHPDDEGNFGIGIWSRWPIESGGLEGFGSPAPQVNVILRLPEARVRFLGLHPVPPVFPRYAAWRNRVYQEVATMLQEAPERLPVIAAGDFNGSRYAPAFQEFCRDAGLHDAGYRDYLERTWPAENIRCFMAIRIDHVLVSDAWRVRDFHVGPNVGSDHYPLVAEVELLRLGNR